MRTISALLIALAALHVAGADEPKDAAPTKRFGIAADLKMYPQTTPKETLASVLKAIDDKRMDYLLAQLADPEFVDRRVQVLGGKFEDLVAEARTRLVDNPASAKHFQKLLKEGQWKEWTSEATVSLKEGDERQVFLRKKDGRWFFENRLKQPAKPANDR